jgi:hypothetical protein
MEMQTSAPTPEIAPRIALSRNRSGSTQALAASSKSAANGNAALGRRRKRSATGQLPHSPSGPPRGCHPAASSKGRLRNRAERASPPRRLGRASAIDYCLWAFCETLAGKGFGPSSIYRSGPRSATNRAARRSATCAVEKLVFDAIVRRIDQVGPGRAYPNERSDSAVTPTMDWAMVGRHESDP